MTQPDYCALCRLCGQGLQAAADRLGRHLAEDHDIPAGTHGLTWSVTSARQGVDLQQCRLEDTPLAPQTHERPRVHMSAQARGQLRCRPLDPVR
jgi:hypothetical protein